MILVDTSVWVEFLRGTSTAATAFVEDRLGGDDLAVTEPVFLELLAGAAPGAHAARIEALLVSQAWCAVDPGLDYRGAVDVFHAARARGRQPRSLQDCLVAAVALRRAVTVAHRDVDYEHIAGATGLATVDLR